MRLALALATVAGLAGCTVTSGKVLSKRIVGTCHELTLQNAEAQTGTRCHPGGIRGLPAPVTPPQR